MEEAADPRSRVATLLERFAADRTLTPPAVPDGRVGLDHEAFADVAHAIATTADHRGDKLA